MQREMCSLHSNHLPIWNSIGAFSGNQISFIQRRCRHSGPEWLLTGNALVVWHWLSSLGPRGRTRNATSLLMLKSTKQIAGAWSRWLFVFVYPEVQAGFTQSWSATPPRYRHHSLDSLRVRDLPQFLYFQKEYVICGKFTDRWSFSRSGRLIDCGFYGDPSFRNCPIPPERFLQGKARLFRRPSQKHVSGLVPFPLIVLSHTWREL